LPVQAAQRIFRACWRRIPTFPFLACLSNPLKGMDSLLSIVQMPAGVPVGTLAIGIPGARNAGLMAAQILALGDAALASRLHSWRQAQTDSVADSPS
jgi:5-(carboxyamino)imidazole ribonucleotide mutase